MPFLMSGSWLSRTVSAVRAAPAVARPGRTGFIRGFATTLNEKKLPLAGVRVLDMSRVLAGVCF